MIHHSLEKLDLIAANKVAAKEGDSKCPYCEYSSSSQQWITKHCFREHGWVRCVACKKCHAPDAPHKCKQTPNHLRKTPLMPLINSTFWLVHCEVCDFKTYGQSEMRHHISTNHLKNGEVHDLLNFKCKHCLLIFKGEALLAEHAQTVHNYFVCSTCEYLIDPTMSRETHSCSKNLMGTNLEVRHGCLLCPATAKSKWNIAVHYETVHLKRKNVKCTECEMTFNSTSAMRAHFRRRHVAEGKFECKDCGIKINSMLSYARHMARHQSGRTVKCFFPGCKFKAAATAAVKVHKAEVHLKYNEGVEQEGDFACSLCPYRVRSQKYLNAHVLMFHEDSTEALMLTG